MKKTILASAVALTFSANAMADVVPETLSEVEESGWSTLDTIATGTFAVVAGLLVSSSSSDKGNDTLYPTYDMPQLDDPIADNTHPEIDNPNRPDVDKPGIPTTPELPNNDVTGEVYVKDGEMYRDGMSIGQLTPVGDNGTYLLSYDLGDGVYGTIAVDIQETADGVYKVTSRDNGWLEVKVGQNGKVELIPNAANPAEKERPIVDKPVDMPNLEPTKLLVTANEENGTTTFTGIRGNDLFVFHNDDDVVFGADNLNPIGTVNRNKQGTVNGITFDSGAQIGEYNLDGLTVKWDNPAAGFDGNLSRTITVTYNEHEVSRDRYSNTWTYNGEVIEKLPKDRLEAAKASGKFETAKSKIQARLN